MTAQAPLVRIGRYGVDVPRELEARERSQTERESRPFFPFTVAGDATAQTGSYTAKQWEIVAVDPSAGGFTVQIPTPSQGAWIGIKNVSTSQNVVTLAPFDSDTTIDGAASYAFSGRRRSAWLVPRNRRDWMLLDAETFGGGPFSASSFSAAGHGYRPWYNTTSGLWEAEAPSPSSVAVDATDYNPIAVWPLSQSSLANSVGGGPALTVGAGTAKYGYFHPRYGAYRFDGTNYLQIAAYDATYDLKSAMTFMAFGILRSYPVTNPMALISHMTSGETEATNALYLLQLDVAGSLTFIQENGAGVNSTHTGTSWIEQGQPFAFGFTRTSGQVIQFYVNYGTWESASAALTAPTGGTSGNLRIGSAPGATFENFLGCMSSVAFWDVALTATQWKTVVNRHLGPAFGRLA